MSLYFTQVVEKVKVKVQADDPIKFGQLAPKNELGQTEDMFELTLSQALGGGGSDKKDLSNLAGSKLNKVSAAINFSYAVVSCEIMTRSLLFFCIGYTADWILGSCLC